MLIAAPASAEQILIKASKLYPGDGPPISPACLLIEDGQVVSISKEYSADDGKQVRELTGAIIIPGLVDAYSQMGIVGGSSETTREITPDFRVSGAVDWSARVFREVVSEGVTAVAISPGTDNVFAGIGIAAKTAGPIGTRIICEDIGLFVTGATGRPLTLAMPATCG
jgi:imidazolonepropionase-like amidohydrolase